MLMNLLTGMNTEKLLNSFLMGMKPEKKAEYLKKFDDALIIAQTTQADFETIKAQNVEILEILHGLQALNNAVEEIETVIEHDNETLEIAQELNGETDERND